MAAKVVQISSDGGTTYNILPGNTAELTKESDALDDTIFGQDFASNQPALIGWSLSGNAFYKGFAGYVACVKKSGTSTVATAEAMSQVGATDTYEIDDAAKSAWDPDATVTVYDNAVAVGAADIDDIDYLFGRVTFAAAYTVTGPVTVDINYLPLTDIAKARTFSLTQTAAMEDVTDLPTAKSNNGHKVFEYSQLSAELSLESFYDSASDLDDLLISRALLLIEINPDGNAKSVARGFFKVSQDSLSGDAGGTESRSNTFTLFVDEDVSKSMSWKHETDTTLSQAVQDMLTAWNDKTQLKMQYYPTGDANPGNEGDVLVSDISLSGGVDAMNEFSVTLQGTDELTDI